jgi:hypothetical protein
MSTYDWTEQHPLLHTRAQAQAVCEQLGFRLAPAKSSSRRPERPRLVGANEDSTARIELIGPDEATALMVSHVAQSTPGIDQAFTQLRDFIDAWLPSWRDARAWLAAHYAPAGPQPPAETRVGDLVVSLRSARDGAVTALTISYAFFGQEHSHAKAAGTGMRIGS